MIHKRFRMSEVFVCESTAKCVISNPNEDEWPSIEKFIEDGNYIPKYVFALEGNEFAVKLQYKYNLDLRTRDGNLVLQTFK
jgi:hypothetical protein